MCIQSDNFPAYFVKFVGNVSVLEEKKVMFYKPDKNFIVRIV